MRSSVTQDRLPARWMSCYRLQVVSAIERFDMLVGVVEIHPGLSTHCDDMSFATVPLRSHLFVPRVGTYVSSAGMATPRPRFAPLEVAIKPFWLLPLISWSLNIYGSPAPFISSHTSESILLALRLSSISRFCGRALHIWSY